MPLDQSRSPATIGTANPIDLAAIGHHAALVTWAGDAGPDARRGFRAVLDERPVEPPAAHCSIARGERQLHVLAVPVPATTLAAAPLEIRGLDGAVLAAASPLRGIIARAGDVDIVALLDELAPAERVRVCRFILEVCPSLLRLGRDSLFAGFAVDIVQSISRRPGRLLAHSVAGPLSIYETAVSRGLGDTLSAVSVSRRGVARCIVAPRDIATTGSTGGVARVGAALDRDVATAGGTLVILGEGGIACRVLPAEAPTESAFDRAASDKGIDAPLRDYIIDALAAVDSPETPTLAAIAEIRAAATPRERSAMAYRGPIAGRLDCVVANAGGLAVIGAIDDPHRLVDALVVTRRNRKTVVELGAMLRRTDTAGSRARPETRFAFALPPTSDAALPASVMIEARLRSGQRVVLGSGPTTPSVADDGAALITAAIATGIDIDRLAATLAATARAAFAAAMPKTEIDVVGIGPAVPSGRSCIVTPLGNDPALLRARFAAIALDHTLDDVGLVFVGDDPTGDERGRAHLAGLTQLYGRGASLASPRVPLPVAAAVNLAVRAIDAELIAVLDATAVPAQAAWLDAMQGALAARPRAGLIAAQMLHPDGCLVDAGLDIEAERGTRGPSARLAGFPAAFPGHEAAQRAGAVRRGAWLMRRSLFALIGGFDDARLTGLGVDLAFARRLARAGFEIWTLGEPCFTVHGMTPADRASALSEAIDRADFEAAAAPPIAAPAAPAVPIQAELPAVEPPVESPTPAIPQAAERKKRQRKSRRAA